MKIHYEGPIVLAILDGVGLGHRREGNAVAAADTPFLNHIIKNYPHLSLNASGEAVGAMKGDMGNSEIGHNAIGAGQVIKQGVAKVEEAFDTGEIWRSTGWRAAIDNIKNTDGTLHFAGIFSDGNIHSNIKHLERLIMQARREGVEHIRVHLVLDGRDVAPQSEPRFIARLENYLARFNNSDYKIASGAGRMAAVADRYENDWDMVKKGWDMIVRGEAEYHFKTAATAIKYFRDKDPEIQDQYIPPFVIDDLDGNPVGPVRDGDSFIYYDFRADRAIEFSMAMTYDDFPYFDRGERPHVVFVGMTEYNNDTHVPALTLVPPVEIDHTLNTFLGTQGITQLAVSETCKFGHITYYFNGNSYNKADGEEHIEIESDTLPFNTRPWMKAAEIADAVIANLEKYQFIRLNFPNGDMVGHFADFEATKVAMSAIDLELARIAKEVDRLGGMMIITADHGNAEELLDDDNQPKSSHSLNKVPCIFYDNTENRRLYGPTRVEDAGLTNLAATIATLFGKQDYPDSWRPSLIKPL